MRTYNRQARRAALCIRARSRRPQEIAISPRGVTLTAYGHDLARLAVSIADELELSGDATDRLLGLRASHARATAGSR